MAHHDAGEQKPSTPSGFARKEAGLTSNKTAIKFCKKDAKGIISGTSQLDLKIDERSKTSQPTCFAYGSNRRLPTVPHKFVSPSLGYPNRHLFSCHGQRLR